jgi:heptosyltransferase-2
MRILLISGGGIGDLLMTTPMFRAIKNTYPQCHLTVLIGQSVNRFLLVDNLYVDDIIDYQSFGGNFVKLASNISRQRFEFAIHNHCCPEWRYYLLPFVTGIPNRLGFDRRSTGKGLKTHFQRLLLTAEISYRAKADLRTRMNLDVLRLLQINDQDISYDVYLNRSESTVKSRVGIHPGSDGNGAIKRWPADNFFELAKRLSAEQSLEVVFFIGPAERQLKQFIVENERIRIFEPDSIGALYELMSTCSMFISNDSGLSHLAAALQLPTVVLFGPTTPTEYILPTKHINVTVKGFECSKCFRSKHCSQHPTTCMSTISVDEVYKAVEKLEDNNSRT